MAGRIIFLLRASLQSLAISTIQDLEPSEASMARQLAPIEDAATRNPRPPPPTTGCLGQRAGATGIQQWLEGGDA